MAASSTTAPATAATAAGAKAGTTAAGAAAGAAAGGVKRSGDGRVVVDARLTLDVRCPWCFIGQRKLTAALKALDSKQFDVQYSVHPFLLTPDAPTPGEERGVQLKRKYGLTDEKLHANHKALAEKGLAQAGITFGGPTGGLGNTVNALRLVQWTADTYGFDKSLALLDAVESATFERNEDPSLTAVLLAEVKRVGGIDEQKAAAFIASDALRADVLARAQAARDRGVQTVPNIVVSGVTAKDGSQTDFAAWFRVLGLVNATAAPPAAAAAAAAAH